MCTRSASLSRPLRALKMKKRNRQKTKKNRGEENNQEGFQWRGDEEGRKEKEVPAGDGRMSTVIA